MEIFGKKIGKIKTGFSAENMRIVTASFNLLQFFPKEIKKDESYELIHKINELENLHKLNRSNDNINKKSYNNNKKTKILAKKAYGQNKGDFLSLVQLKDNESEEVLRKFYEVFPKPNEKCKGL